MRFSIVIPTYNRRQMLRQCLDAATRLNHPDYEVLVVDDASSDGTAAMVREQFPNIRLIQQAANRGPAAARNRGIETAKGDIVAFTDDDCTVPVDWLYTLQNAFERYPDAGAIGGSQEPPEAVWQHNLLARYERFVTREIYGIGSGDVIARPAPGGTNNLAIRKKVLQKIGGFDERFPVAAGEDADVLRRIADLGYETVCLPLHVTHHQPYTWQSFTRQQLRRGIGAAYFQHKHSKLHPFGGEVLRLLAVPLLFIRHSVRHHSVQMGFVHTISGVLQVVGRLQARRHLRRLAPSKAWLVTPSPTKLRYVDEYAIGSTALDVGSGCGFYTRRLVQKGFDVVSTDLANPASGHQHFVQASLRSLPFDRKFDTVLCFDVLEHEQQESRAIQELRRVVGKRLLLSVPNEDDLLLHAYNLTYKHHIDKTHYREYSRKRLQELLEEAGFRILTIRGEGPVHPAVLAEFVRPRMLQGPVRLLLKALHRCGILAQSNLMADVYVVAEPKE